MSRHRAGRTPRRGRRLLASVAALAAGIAAVLVLQVPGAQGAFLAKVTNDKNTAASNPYFTCTAAVSDTNVGRAYFAYPFAETSGTTAADVSGSNNPGTYSSSGVTYNAAPGPCSKESKSSITLDGAKGYVSGPPNGLTGVLGVLGTNVFTEGIWFRTSTAGGKLIGFGSSRTGSSGTYDRHLYIDTGGHVVFGVYPSTAKTIASPATYVDNKWHYAAATLSSAGMILYMDGAQVAADAAVTTAQVNTGYWRIGYDNLNGWPGAATNYFFQGDLAWAAAYTVALTAAQIRAHYAVGSA